MPSHSEPQHSGVQNPPCRSSQVVRAIRALPATRQPLPDAPELCPVLRAPATMRPARHPLWRFLPCSAARTGHLGGISPDHPQTNSHLHLPLQHARATPTSDLQSVRFRAQRKRVPVAPRPSLAALRSAAVRQRRTTQRPPAATSSTAHFGRSSTRRRQSPQSPARAERNRAERAAADMPQPPRGARPFGPENPAGTHFLAIVHRIP